MDDIKLKEWLKKRIEKTQEEVDSIQDRQIKIVKGSKLTVYKEVLEYVNKNSD